MKIKSPQIYYNEIASKEINILKAAREKVTHYIQKNNDVNNSEILRNQKAIVIPYQKLFPDLHLHGFNILR